MFRSGGVKVPLAEMLVGDLSIGHRAAFLLLLLANSLFVEVSLLLEKMRIRRLYVLVS